MTDIVAGPVYCAQVIWPHRCRLVDCPKDDPDHVHQCWVDDFDWKEGDFVEYRLGRIDIAELLTRGLVLVYFRLSGRMGDEARASAELQLRDGHLPGRVRSWLASIRATETAEGVTLKADKTGLHFADPETGERIADPEPMAGGFPEGPWNPATDTQERR